MRNAHLNRYFSFTPFLPHFSVIQKIYKNNLKPSVVEGVSLLGVPITRLLIYNSIDTVAADGKDRVDQM